MNIFAIYLRAVFRQWPLFLLLIACQLTLGEISSVALNEKKPELKIALSAEGGGELAERYALALEQIPELTVIRAEGTADKEKIFAAHPVQGLAVIPPDFDERLTDGRAGGIVLYPAPGVSDVSLVAEFLAVEAVMLRAEILLQSQLRALGAVPEDAGNFSAVEPILTVAYDGPPAAAQPLAVPPAFGLPALFLLLAFLQAAQIAPGPDNRRILLHGRPALARACAASWLALWCAWGMLTVLYVLGLGLFYHIKAALPLSGALLFLALYAASLGGLLALTGKRAWAVWIFIPWFLLNMTLGGGLWNTPPASPLLLPLLPLGAVAAAQAGEWTALWALAGQSTAAVAVAALLLRRGRAKLPGNYI
ncbi:MAG: hypothetical protein LBQ16_03720 [Gracilibacteraceae bacterium]|jgi:hypothetical protein|nr:hypothetical protein [Gracilibacteraceae bacterium]